MRHDKKHKLTKRIMASAFAMLLTGGGLTFTGVQTAYAEQNPLEQDAQYSELTLQNVRKETIEEDGFVKECIMWDEPEDAYGYTVRASRGDEESFSGTYYDNFVEWKRFFYDNNVDFGEYTFDICAFDEASNSGEWSEQIVVSYEPVLETLLNVRLSEDGKQILWDKIEGVARYNYRIKKGSELYVRYWYSKDSDSMWVSNELSSSGDYTFEIQAMDKNYNVSAWSEPIEVSYVEETRKELEAPKNAHLDENGCLCWDAVEGADGYYINVESYKDNECYYSTGVNTEETQYSEWKSLLPPVSKEEYEIRIQAYGYEPYAYSEYSETLTGNISYVRDESMALPENVSHEGDSLLWDVDNTKTYWSTFALYSEEGRQIYDCGLDVHFNGYCSRYIDAMRLPSGTYEAEIFVVDENGNYNSKKYPVEINTVPDDSVWIPKLYYKFDQLLWDWDQLRHENTSYFWLRLKNEDGTVSLNNNGSNSYWLGGLEDGKYTVEICAAENYGKIGKWTEFSFQKHSGGLFDKENESTSDVEQAPEASEIPEEDRVTSITVNPAFNMKNKEDENVEFDLSQIRIKAKEIYDEEGLKRAEEALGNEIVGNKHYNLLNLTLWEGDRDISNGYDGLVQVIIPLPKGHRDKTFSCYRLTEIDGEMTKEVIPGEQTEDSYIIYLEHFSQYALVADGGEEEHTHVFDSDWKSDDASHWHECECGERTDAAEHTAGEWKTDAEAGVRYKECTVCGMRVETAPMETEPEETAPGETKPEETEPTENGGTGDNDSPNMGGGSGVLGLMLLAVLGAATIGIGITVLTVSKKNKASSIQ